MFCLNVCRRCTSRWSSNAISRPPSAPSDSNSDGMTSHNPEASFDHNTRIAFKSGSLYVARCADDECSSVTRSLIAEGGAAGISMVVGADGLAVLGFSRQQQLIIAHCQDAACTDAIVSVIDESISGSDNPHNIAIELGSDGLPVIASYNSLSRDLKVIHCPDPVTCVP